MNNHKRKPLEANTSARPPRAPSKLENLLQKSHIPKGVKTTSSRKSHREKQGTSKAKDSKHEKELKKNRDDKTQICQAHEDLQNNNTTKANFGEATRVSDDEVFVSEKPRPQGENTQTTADRKSSSDDSQSSLKHFSVSLADSAAAWTAIAALDRRGKHIVDGKVVTMDGGHRPRRHSRMRYRSLPVKEEIEKARPRSEEFHLNVNDHKSQGATPFRKGHQRSPSDGQKYFKPPEPSSRDPSPSTVPKSPGFLSRMFSMRQKSPSKDYRRSFRTSDLDAAAVEAEMAEIMKNEAQGIKKPERRFTSRKLIRVRSQDREDSCSSPPIAKFSDDEDIESCPSSPRPATGGAHDRRSGIHHKTITPELGAQISRVLLKPPMQHKFPDSDSEIGNDYGGVSPRSSTCTSPRSSVCSSRTSVCSSPRTSVCTSPRSSVCVSPRSSTCTSPRTSICGSPKSSVCSNPPGNYPQGRNLTTETQPGKKYVNSPRHSADIPVGKPPPSPRPPRKAVSLGSSPFENGRRHNTIDLADIMVPDPSDPSSRMTLGMQGGQDTTSVKDKNATSNEESACATEISAKPKKESSDFQETKNTRYSPHAYQRSSSHGVKVVPPASVKLERVTSQPSLTGETPTEPFSRAAPERWTWGKTTTTRQVVEVPKWTSIITHTRVETVSRGTSSAEAEAASGTSTEAVGEEPTMQVVRRLRASPETTRERPKSDSLNIRWAAIGQDLLPRQLRDRDRSRSKERPKSDLGGSSKALSDALEQLELGDSLSTLPDIFRDEDGNRKKQPRRMSTPHPIKLRQDRSPPTRERNTNKKSRIRRSKSAPDDLDSMGRRIRHIHLRASSDHAGDLAIQAGQFSSDDEVVSEDTISLGAASETSSVGSVGKQSRLEELFEETRCYVEALWDHVTLDPEELGFHAGDVVEVYDMSDKDWWWGKMEGREGWLPAAFVRLRANQDETAEDFVQKVREGTIDQDTAMRRYSLNFVSKDQARTNVVNEIIQAEREYVKHLRDVIEGYVEKARKRPEMFSRDQLYNIFANLEDIYSFSNSFLISLERHIVPDTPHRSELGRCFLSFSKEFEIYSEYCNNHPQAVSELKELYRNRRYLHFFEACRLLQQMIEIPLEGFLLNPVQKICKYPLQLAELLKYTRPEHPDYQPLVEALAAMKHIAVFINERKRKMESIEKLAAWQESVQDWEPPDLLEHSTELIYSGEVTKVNSTGWSQDRTFFLFDHQLVYCKKDLLWRDLLVYKGRIDTDNCDIIPVKDGKESQFNVNIKNGWKIHDKSKDKWFLLHGRSAEDKKRWLKAFHDERQRVKEDKENGFVISRRQKEAAMTNIRQKYHPDKPKDKGGSRKNSHSSMPYQEDRLKKLSIHGTLPRNLGVTDASKRKTWLPFVKKKSGKR